MTSSAEPPATRIIRQNFQARSAFVAPVGRKLEHRVPKRAGMPLPGY